MNKGNRTLKKWKVYACTLEGYQGILNQIRFFSRRSVFNFLQKKAFNSESLIFGYFCVCVSLSKDRHYLVPMFPTVGCNGEFSTIWARNRIRKRVFYQKDTPYIRLNKRELFFPFTVKLLLSQAMLIICHKADALWSLHVHAPVS